LYQDAAEFESFRTEASISNGRLQALLGHLAITTAPKYQIKRLSHRGRLEFRDIMEIFHGSKVVSSHMGPAHQASNNNIVANTFCQAITS
jgi:hypothetical protein